MELAALHRAGLQVATDPHGSCSCVFFCQDTVWKCIGHNNNKPSDGGAVYFPGPGEWMEVEVRGLLYDEPQIQNNLPSRPSVAHRLPEWSGWVGLIISLTPSISTKRWVSPRAMGCSAPLWEESARMSSAKSDWVIKPKRFWGSIWFPGHCWGKPRRLRAGEGRKETPKQWIGGFIQLQIQFFFIILPSMKINDTITKKKRGCVSWRASNTKAYVSGKSLSVKACGHFLKVFTKTWSEREVCMLPPRLCTLPAPLHSPDSKKSSRSKTKIAVICLRSPSPAAAVCVCVCARVYKFHLYLFLEQTNPNNYDSS